METSGKAYEIWKITALQIHFINMNPFIEEMAADSCLPCGSCFSFCADSFDFDFRYAIYYMKVYRHSMYPVILKAMLQHEKYRKTNKNI